MAYIYGLVTVGCHVRPICVDQIKFNSISMLCFTEEASKKHPFPCPTTYRTALGHYLDITNPPRTNVLKELSEYAEDETEKQFLLKMTGTSPEGRVSPYMLALNKEQKDIMVKHLDPIFQDSRVPAVRLCGLSSALGSAQLSNLHRLLRVE